MNRPVLLSVQCVAAQAQLRKHAALLSPQLHRQHRGGFLRVHRERLCSVGWSWKLELEWCERKTLLLDWWLEAGAEAV